MSVRVVFLWLWLSTGAFAQGFAGLGTDVAGFRLPYPDYRFVFPDDHGAHPGFRIEWWYLTANLEGEDGQDYGVQWTLFRSALDPADKTPPIWMGHAAVTTPKQHFAAERFARGGTGQAGVTSAPFEAWIDEWQMAGIEGVRLTARGAAFSYDLALTSDAPFIPQGVEGYSVKSASGQASHYYSQPFYQVTGVLNLPDGQVEVSGQAWLDREWSSQPLDEDQAGWDWVSLHLDDGTKLMAAQVRNAVGRDYAAGNWITPGGIPTPLGPEEVTLTAQETTRIDGREVPTRWRVEVPRRKLDVEVSALNPMAWMDLTVSYWEGPVVVTGSHGGVGYLEMTGYE